MFSDCMALLHVASCCLMLFIVFHVVFSGSIRGAHFVSSDSIRTPHDVSIMVVLLMLLMSFLVILSMLCGCACVCGMRKLGTGK